MQQLEFSFKQSYYTKCCRNLESPLFCNLFILMRMPAMDVVMSSFDLDKNWPVFSSRQRNWKGEGSRCLPSDKHRYASFWRWGRHGRIPPRRHTKILIFQLSSALRICWEEWQLKTRWRNWCRVRIERIEWNSASIMLIDKGDITNWMNQTTGAFNSSGLVANMEEKAGSFYGKWTLPTYLVRVIRKSPNTPLTMEMCCK